MSIAEKLQTAADNQQKVYDAGFAAGQAVGGDTDAAYQEGYDTGKQAYWDAVWDGIQNGGARVDYSNAFGKYWNTEIFKPKYDMTPTSGVQMFNRFGGEVITDAPPVDLAGILERAGVRLDTSQIPNFANFFYYSSVGHVPEISVISSKSKLIGMFGLCKKLVKIDKLILKNDGTDIFDGTFLQTAALTDIVIEGVIGNSIDLSYSPLNRASIESVMNALSHTTTERSISFNKSAVNAAFTTDEWNALVATKPNWTITLA